MRRLILSDIHANLDALEAVLNDAAGNWDEAVCCGDIVGYGASPVEAIEWTRRYADCLVRGNHDKACAGLLEMGDFNQAARASVLWTRAQLSAADMDWLKGLPAGPAFRADYQVVHGTPADEDEYAITAAEVEPIESHLLRTVCFAGHSHVQGGWSWQRGGLIPLSRPGFSESERVIDLDPDYLYLINPGSVGQPRDRDPRAAYAIWDTENRLLHFRRVRYDFRLAQGRILEAGLPEILAERLATGR
ncbi:MAG: metallophosphoesterase family protein [Acidobacteria bacterium]|nr:metallophosphoesterase family protein [Acidobacteriota bacterium]